MKPASRQELIDFCLRKLGQPLIEINVDSGQCEDRLDDALQYMQTYHMDGVERLYHKHQLTASFFTLTTNNAASFTNGEVVTGSISGARSLVIQTGSVGNTLRHKGINGTFLASENLTGDKSASVAQLAATNFLVLGDIDNRFIPLSDSIIGVNKIIPFTDTMAANINMFDIRYQLRLNDLFDLYSTSVVYYTQVQQHLSLLNMTLVGEKPIRFNRHMNRLYIDMDWLNYVRPDQWLIVDAYRILDPDTYTDVYNDEFLKRYLSALLKRQWGQNMSKFDNIELPGGVKMNGWQIYQAGDDEITKIEDEMQSRYQLPPMMQIG